MTRKIRCKAEAETALGAGYARITLLGVEPFNGTTLKVKIEHGGETNPVLGPNGWQSGMHWLSPDSIEIVKGETTLFLGPSVTRHIRVGTTVELTFQGDGPWPETDSAVSWPAIVAEPGKAEQGTRRRISLGRGQAATPDESAVDPKPKESAPPPAAKQQPNMRHASAPPAQPPVKTGGSGGIWIGVVAGLLFFAVAGAGAYGYLNGWFASEQDVVTTEPSLEPEPAPTAWAANEVRTYLSKTPTTADSLAQAQLQMETGNLDMAFLLYKNAAGQDDAEALTALGKMYDPDLHSAKTSPLPSPNPGLAADYYKRAADAGNVLAQRRLGILMMEGRHGADADITAGRQLLSTAAAAGDEEAKTYLEAHP